MTDDKPLLKYGLAKRMRKTMTQPEVWLWARIKGRNHGNHFRKQHPIGPYIVDFYCAKANLVIEVEGAVHDVLSIAQKDAVRVAWLESQGLEVMRIPARDIMADPDEIALGVIMRATELTLRR